MQKAWRQEGWIAVPSDWGELWELRLGGCEGAGHGPQSSVAVLGSLDYLRNELGGNEVFKQDADIFSVGFEGSLRLEHSK